MHKSPPPFFSKILEKPSIVQKKMIPHINGLGFSLIWSKKKFKMADLKNSKWPPQKNLIFQLCQFSIFSAIWMVFPESWKRRAADFYAHHCILGIFFRPKFPIFDLLASFGQSQRCQKPLHQNAVFSFLRKCCRNLALVKMTFFRLIFVEIHRYVERFSDFD